MHRMPRHLELYEEMDLLSSRMVAAARCGDWDNLIELERHVTNLRNILLATLEDTSAPGNDLDRKRNLIARILENDAEVRRYTEPWMEHIRAYLGDSTRRHIVTGHETGAGAPAAGSYRA
jgi:flagellar protein FliT